MEREPDAEEMADAAADLDKTDMPDPGDEEWSGPDPTELLPEEASDEERPGYGA